MNLQKTIPLSDIYDREEDFSADLADTLDALNVGKFEDAETEATLARVELILSQSDWMELL